MVCKGIFNTVSATVIYFFPVSAYFKHIQNLESADN